LGEGSIIGHAPRHNKSAATTGGGGGKRRKVDDRVLFQTWDSAAVSQREQDSSLNAAKNSARPGRTTPYGAGGASVKRVVDVTVGLVLSVLVLPAIVALALATALVLRAWPFFTQDRIGFGGSRFRFVKIRTLPASAPPYADKYELASVRSPWLSQRLRRLHLDELPQLLLVVTGKMSLVGPRPEMPALHADFAPDFAIDRTAVRPGCTGLWQIGERCDHLIGEAPEYDAFYLAHTSLRLDAWILWRTLVMVVRGTTVNLDAVPSWALGRERVVIPATVERAGAEIR
jgi:lipopolysaccharide/colanic/teichoic acid biosynthesis glycosyltransferase